MGTRQGWARGWGEAGRGRDAQRGRGHERGHGVGMERDDMNMGTGMGMDTDMDTVGMENMGVGTRSYGEVVGRLCGGPERVRGRENLVSSTHQRQPRHVGQHTLVECYRSNNTDLFVEPARDDAHDLLIALRVIRGLGDLRHDRAVRAPRLGGWGVGENRIVGCVACAAIDRAASHAPL